MLVVLVKLLLNQRRLWHCFLYCCPFVIISSADSAVNSNREEVVRANLQIFFQTTRSEFDSCEYEVRRRYQDFLWLRSRLEENYPTLIVHVCISTPHHLLNTSMGYFRVHVDHTRVLDVTAHLPEVAHS